MAEVDIISAIEAPVTTTTLPPTSVTSTTLAATTTTAPPLDLTEPLVWFAPNMASTDFVELFSEPETWATARAEVDVFKFYSANLFPRPVRDLW